MAREDFEKPVYLITGFLESGKTTFLDGTIRQNYFQIPETTLLILCEEGEEEYDEKELKKRYRTVVEVIEEPEDFTTESLEYLDRKHHPERILVEFNPLWSVEKFLNMQLPADWTIVQHIVTVDASCFQVYMNNLKSLFVEMVRKADMVIFNRCRKELPLASFRRSVKVVNPAAEIIFENENHEVEDIFEDSLPYNLEDDIVDIMEEDYGIWYVDMMENPDRYKGKVVEYVAKVLKPRTFPAKVFMAGRMAMTCCADDTSFLGYVCRSAYAPKLKPGQWVKIRAKIRFANVSVYRGEGPVLEAEHIELADPIEELVYFN